MEAINVFIAVVIWIIASQIWLDWLGTYERRKVMLRVIVYEPGKGPRTAYVENTLEALQEVVGGRIETVTLKDDVVAICNRDGLMSNLKYCCTLYGIQFFGPVILAGYSGDEFTDIPRYMLEVAGCT